MNARDINRPFLTFHELAVSWNGDMNLVRHAIVSGALTPMAFVNGAAIGGLDGVYYMHMLKRTAFLDCTFSCVALEVKPPEGGHYWRLREPVSLGAILSEGAVDKDQVSLYEAENRRTGSFESLAEVRSGARISLLKMTTGMALAAYGYNPDERRSSVLPEIARDIRKYGMRIDDDTVRSWVYEGVQTQLPINWRDILKAS